MSSSREKAREITNLNLRIAELEDCVDLPTLGQKARQRVLAAQSPARQRHRAGPIQL